MAKKLLTERTINILVPVLSVIFGLLVGAIVMLVSGYDQLLVIVHFGQECSAAQVRLVKRSVQ